MLQCFKGDGNMKKCVRCKKEFSSDVKFCPICGYEDNNIKTNKEKDEFKVCPKCSSVFLYEIDHCTHCGYSTEKYKRRMRSLGDENISHNKEIHLPKCPMCGSTNIQKISDFSRASSIIGFGILSKKIGKQWQCNNPKCKHLW